MDYDISNITKYDGKYDAYGTMISTLVIIPVTTALIYFAMVYSGSSNGMKALGTFLVLSFVFIQLFVYPVFVQKKVVGHNQGVWDFFINLGMVLLFSVVLSVVTINIYDKDKQPSFMQPLAISAVMFGLIAFLGSYVYPKYIYSSQKDSNRSKQVYNNLDDDRINVDSDMIDPVKSSIYLDIYREDEKPFKRSEIVIRDVNGNKLSENKYEYKVDNVQVVNSIHVPPGNGLGTITLMNRDDPNKVIPVVVQIAVVNSKGDKYADFIKFKLSKSRKVGLDNNGKLVLL